MPCQWLHDFGVSFPLFNDPRVIKKILRRRETSPARHDEKGKYGYENEKITHIWHVHDAEASREPTHAMATTCTHLDMREPEKCFPTHVWP